MQRHHIVIIFMLFTQPILHGQGVIEFLIDFHGNPPPHTPGVPNSSALCTNAWTTYASFFADIFLADTAPSSGRIVDRGDDGSLTPVFQFTRLVYRTYPQSGGARAYSYEQGWYVTGAQVDRLSASRWFVEIGFPGQTYLGQIVPVAEPSTVSCGLCGGLALLAVSRIRRKSRPNQARQPTPESVMREREIAEPGAVALNRWVHQR